MRADEFARRIWAGEGGVLGAVLRGGLAPVEAAFRGVVAARNGAYDRGWLRSERVAVPLVSIGNVAVGGAGKTPFAAWLARRLADEGRKPAIALRGYGEDEILLHRELNPGIPVFRGKRRVEAARSAVEAGCDVVVLDDAFQHRALARDLDIVLLPVEGWDQRPHMLPRGPWREDLSALGRADLVVLTRKSAGQARATEVAAELMRLHPRMPIVRCALLPSALRPLHGGAPSGVDALAGRRVLAVAALATPEPFFATVREAGAEVEEAAYPDHHPFSAENARALVSRAAGRMLVMTHKDAVKLRLLLAPAGDAWVLEQRVVIEDGMDVLDTALRRALMGAAG